MTTPAEARNKALAKAAAKEAVHEMLLALGVDSTKPEAVLAMQADFQHLRAWREASDAVKRNSLKALVTVIVTCVVGYALVFFGLRAGGP